VLTYTSVQVLGALAADPQIELYAVSRSAHWYLPSRNGSRNSAPYSEGQRALYRNFPFINRLARNLLYLRQEAVWPLFKLENGFVRGLVQRYIERWMRKQLPKELKDVAIPDFREWRIVRMVADIQLLALSVSSLRTATSRLSTRRM
jgi:hypothetical protein